MGEHYNLYMIEIGELDLHWLAGLLEGEGSFLAGPPSRPTHPIVAVEMTDEDIVARIAQLWGCSYQLWPRRKSHHKDTFRVRLTGGSAVAAMRAVYPLLGNRRRQQIDTALACYVQKSRGGQNKKITAEQAAEIRERRDLGESAQLIADDYGVTKWNVYAIAQGRSWQTQS